MSREDYTLLAGGLLSKWYERNKCSRSRVKIFHSGPKGPARRSGTRIREGEGSTGRKIFLLDAANPIINSERVVVAARDFSHVTLGARADRKRFAFARNSRGETPRFTPWHFPVLSGKLSYYMYARRRIADALTFALLFADTRYSPDGLWRAHVKKCRHRFARCTCHICAGWSISY